MLEKKQMLDLTNVTLITVSSVRIDDTIDALRHCMKGITFGAVKFITHERPKNLPPEIEFGQCPKITSLAEYSYYMLFKLKDHVETPYCLTIQQDGVVVHPRLWQNIFFNYDYIGAPWPEGVFKNSAGEFERVGNGGFSFRSKKLLELPSQLKLPFQGEGSCLHEDTLLCVDYKPILTQHGAVFAGIEVARHFSHEMAVPEVKGIKPFGFHKYRKKNKFYHKFPSTFTKIKRFFKSLFKV